MPLIPETGDGLPTANSYATVADADAYHAATMSADAWGELDLVEKEQRLVAATRLLDSMFAWVGFPMRHGQALGFPRRDISGRNGVAYPLRYIPREIRAATIELALYLQDDATSAATIGAESVQEITLGPIGIKLAAGADATTTKTSRPMIPLATMASIRQWGDYLGGGGSVGRLVR